jgi:vanillate O-demethylase monooxygenase subunit
MDERPDHQFYNLNIDAGSMWARRLIDRMLAVEQGKAPAGPKIAAE